MKLPRQPVFVISTLLLVALACQTEKIEIPSLSTLPGQIEFTSAGGTLPLTILMSGNSWRATSNQTWCTLSIAESNEANTTIQVMVQASNLREKRTASIEIVSDSKLSVSVGIVQNVDEGVYPNYSFWKTSDVSGMTSNAFALASKMEAGWNLGNSLEVPGNETDWGNPKVTQAFINSVKAAGINAIRIPCAWDSYVEDVSTLKLKAIWLSRVQEVIDYCVSQDMYAILNIHWDGGWLENNPVYAKQKLVNGKQRAFWEQIAMHFRDYDEHLLFAGTNEVHVNGTPTNENFEVQMSFNQTFVDAVRSTGGKNSYRNLIVQAYNTNIDYAFTKMITPSDTATNRLMVEVHYYDPWDFCGLESDASWATVKYFWGADFAQYGEISNWGQEDYALGQFQKLKSKFVDNGFPVILGEYGALRRASSITNYVQHIDSRAHYLQFITREAKNYGAVPFLWDNGVTGNLGFGLFNRNSGAVTDVKALNAFLIGASEGHYPF